MLKILSGVLKPTTGNLRVNGSLSALIEIGAGFHPELTGRQNIYLNGTILGMSRREIAKKFDQIVAFSGLEEFLDTPVKRYSTGMYARLGFSVAAHVDPEILIVDEVLSVGDYAFQNKCMERMKEIVTGGAAVIFVSHNLSAVATLCTRALLLDHGRVVEEGTPQDVIQTYLRQARAPIENGAGKEAYIANVVIRDEYAPKMRFESGDDVWLDIEVKANQDCRDLSLTLYLCDDKNYGIFDTSTERLGVPSFSLVGGETAHFTFRLKLHLARGTFHVGTLIYQYNIQKMYDHRVPAGTIFVTSARDVRGVANLYPVVLKEPPASAAPVVETRQCLVNGRQNPVAAN
jgi:lipopolysaccharide transport system ATP-binding protein